MKDYMKMAPPMLLLELEAAASEKALLTYSDAPDAELASVQRTIDTISEEVLRRMSW